MLWGDNDPYFVQANWILDSISAGRDAIGQDIKIRLQGNLTGGKVL